ncbi:4400_t:CDS:2, partial [Scutellospora calospora]
SESNKYLLKVSFVRSLQRKISTIENTEDSESIIFVVEQIEVIDRIFYVNVKDINYINIKKRISDTVQLPNSNNTESRPSAKCKRTKESYEYLLEIENTNFTINCKLETNNNLTKNTKLQKNQKTSTCNQRKGKKQLTQNIETPQNLDQEIVNSDKK